MSRYDWLREQVRAVPRETFFTFQPLPEAELLRLQEEIGPLPEEYLEFAREFGSAQLFRCPTSPRYYLYVCTPPYRHEFPSLGPGQWPGGVFFELGAQVNSGPVWLSGRAAAGGPAAGLLAGYPPYFRRCSGSFEEWLRRSFDASRRLYTRKEWAEVMTPVPPFTPAERRIVDAMPRFEFRTLSISESGIFTVEVTNRSDTELPWLTVKVGFPPSPGMGGTCLPVHRLAPGQTRIVEDDLSAYKSLGDPRTFTLIRAPLPHPEERAYYWEFCGPPEDWRRGQPWPPKQEDQPTAIRQQRRHRRAGRPPQEGSAGLATPKRRSAKGPDRASPDPGYGPWKFIHEIELADLQQHPVWLWCLQLGLPGEEDGPIGGDETSMRPLLGSDEVPVDHVAPPLILLRVRDSSHYASGLCGNQGQTLEAISVFVGKDVMPPAAVSSLPDPAVYEAVPAIRGQRGVAFQSTAKGAGEARRV